MSLVEDVAGHTVEQYSVQGPPSARWSMHFSYAPTDKAGRGIQVCQRRVVVVDLAGEEL